MTDGEIIVDTAKINDLMELFLGLNEKYRELADLLEAFQRSVCPENTSLTELRTECIREAECFSGLREAFDVFLDDYQAARFSLHQMLEEAKSNNALGEF